MMRWKWQRWAVAGVVLMSSGAALAVDPAVKCEAQKLKIAGKYAFCRMQAEAKANAKFEAPDFSTEEAFEHRVVCQQFVSNIVAIRDKTFEQGNIIFPKTALFKVPSGLAKRKFLQLLTFESILAD